MDEKVKKELGYPIAEYTIPLLSLETMLHLEEWLKYKKEESKTIPETKRILDDILEYHEVIPRPSGFSVITKALAFYKLKLDRDIKQIEEFVTSECFQTRKKELMKDE